MPIGLVIRSFGNLRSLSLVPSVRRDSETKARELCLPSADVSADVDLMRHIVVVCAKIRGALRSKRAKTLFIKKQDGRLVQTFV